MFLCITRITKFLWCSIVTPDLLKSTFPVIPCSTYIFYNTQLMETHTYVTCCVHYARCFLSGRATQGIMQLPCIHTVIKYIPGDYYKSTIYYKVLFLCYYILLCVCTFQERYIARYTRFVHTENVTALHAVDNVVVKHNKYNIVFYVIKFAICTRHIIRLIHCM